MISQSQNINLQQPTSKSPFQVNNALVSNNPRTEEIKNIYLKTLGRLPEQSDVNLIINMRMSDFDLIHKMISSNEHYEILKCRREILSNIAKQINLKDQLDTILSKHDDLEKIVNYYKSLISQKSSEIESLKSENQKLRSSNIHLLSQINKLNMFISRFRGANPISRIFLSADKRIGNIPIKS